MGAPLRLGPAAESCALAVIITADLHGDRWCRRQWARMHILFQANGLGQLKEIRLALGPQEAVCGARHDVREGVVYC